MGSEMRFSICWDCSNATGGCAWSESLKPVKGWNAEKINKVDSAGVKYTTYLIHKCPKFHRDAIGFGQKWINKENDYA